MNFKKIVIGSVAALMATTPLLAMAEHTSSVQAASTENKKEKGTLTIRAYGAHVYGKDGKKLNSYRGGKPYLKEGDEVKYYSGPLYMNKYNLRSRNYKKAIFYDIGDGGYILGYNIASMNGKGVLSVYHNAYVYYKNGKRLKKYQGSKANTLIRKGTAINYVGKINEMSNTDKDMPKFYYFNTGDQRTADKMLWVSYKTIKGKQYYNIGSGGYIKAANIAYSDGKELFADEAVVTLGKSSQGNGKYYAWKNQDYHGKITKTLLPYKEGQKVVVDRYFKDARSFWRIKGTNNYIFGPDIKKFPLQALRY